MSWSDWISVQCAPSLNTVAIDIGLSTFHYHCSHLFYQASLNWGFMTTDSLFYYTKVFWRIFNVSKGKAFIPMIERHLRKGMV